MVFIYNSRNYYRLLNLYMGYKSDYIYNSRNYYRLLNGRKLIQAISSTTVEITIGYLTKDIDTLPLHLQQ